MGTNTAVGEGTTSVIGTGTAVTLLCVGDVTGVVPGKVAVGMTLVGGIVPWTGVSGMVGGGGGLTPVACAVESGTVFLTAFVGVGVLTSIVGTGGKSVLFATGVGDIDESSFGTPKDRTRVGDGPGEEDAGLGAADAVGAMVGPGVTGLRRIEFPKAPATRMLSSLVPDGKVIEPLAI